MIMAGENYPDEQRYQYLTKFGIGQPTGLNLPGESSGLLTNPSAWNLRTRNTILFGQGYTVNALQLNNVVATIANKGVKQQQSIIKSTTDANGKTTETKKGEATRVVDEKGRIGHDECDGISGGRLQQVRQGRWLPHGRQVRYRRGAGLNGMSSIISDYSVVIPADNPRYAVTVVMRIERRCSGGLTAGPVSAQICEFLTAEIRGACLQSTQKCYSSHVVRIRGRKAIAHECSERIHRPAGDPGNAGRTVRF